VVIENREVGLVQIAHKFAVLVGRDEQNVDFIHPLADGENRIGLVVGRGPGRYRGSHGQKCACAGANIGRWVARSLR